MKLKKGFIWKIALIITIKMVDYLKKALIYGHTRRISS